MMSVISSCITWVPILWGQLFGSINKNKAVDDPLPDFPTVDNPLPDLLAVHNPLPNLPAVDELLPDLPYHIIVDILSRLPANCVFECQRVFRPLNILTTTPFFTRTHLSQANSVIVLQSFTQSICNRVINLHFIDDETEKIESKSMEMDLCYMRPNNPIVLYGSYDGFILFRNRYMNIPFFLIWNPITKELVTLTSPCSYLYVCGFYFHPLKKEYEVLFTYKNGTQFEFQILTLGTKSWRRIGYCSYPPSCERPPVIVNGTLYWMVDYCIYYETNHVYPSESHSVVSFRIETEEFSTMEPGGRVGLEIVQRELIHLLEMEGQLWLCDPIYSNKLVLWVLNHTTMHWVQRHVLILPLVEFCIPWPNKFRTEVVHIKNGELLVRQSRGLFLYNLHLGTVELKKVFGFEKDNFQVTIHTHSLLSLHSERIISLRKPTFTACNKQTKGVSSK